MPIRKDTVFRLRFFSASVAVLAAVVFSASPVQAAPAAAVSGGTIEGTLTSAKGVPVAGVRVLVSSSTGKNDTLPLVSTDESGHYTLTPLPAGRYRVGFYFPETMSEQWVPKATRETRGAWFTVRDGQTTVVDESLFPTGALDITLLGRDTSEPLAAFCVEAIGDRYLKTGCTTTGVLHLEELPVDSYLLMVEADGEPGVNPEFADVIEDTTTSVAVQQR
jgi:hypothetical protein